MEISNILIIGLSLSVLLLSSLVPFLISYAVKNGKWLCRRPSSNLPPGPSPLPILGNILLFMSKRQPHKSLTELAMNTYGPIMALKLGSITSIVISSSKLAKQVLLQNGYCFSTPFILDAVHAHQHDKYSVAWLPSSSPKWRALRKIYGSQLLSDKKLNSMEDFRRQRVLKLLAYVDKCSQDRVVVDIGKTTLSAFFQIMLNTIFSRDFVNDDNKSREIEKLIYQIIAETSKPNVADLFPFFKYFNPQRIKYRLTVHVVKLFKVFNSIIDIRSKLVRNDIHELHSSGEINPDILDVLLGVMEEGMDGIDRDYILHLLLDLFGAGMDTTSKTIEWAMSELLNNPSILSKVQEELDKTIGKGKLVEEPDISKLPYLQAVVKETLRLHPPAPLLLPRKIEQDIKIAGFTLPKGAQLLVNVWAIGRDPNAWDNPNSFVPNRFLNDSKDVDLKGQHFDLIPFGAGRRICPGMPLALRTVPSILASLVNCFDWKLEEADLDHQYKLGMDLEDEVRITLKKAKPLLAIPTARVICC